LPFALPHGAAAEEPADPDPDLLWLEAVRPASDPGLSERRETLGLRLYAEGRYDGARRLFALVEAVRAEALGPDPFPLLHIRANLAVATKETGDLAGAIDLEELVLSGLAPHAFPPDDPRLRRIRSNLVDTYGRVGDHDAALALARRQLEEIEASAGPDAASAVAARFTMASAFLGAGRDEDALPLFREVLRAREEESEEDDLGVQQARVNLAAVLFRTGRYDAARRRLDLALAAYERRLRPDHPDLLLARQNLVLCLVRTGQLDRARRLQQRTLDALEGMFADDHPQVASARETLGIVRLEMGDPTGALHLLAKAYEGYRARFPADHDHVRRTRGSLGTAWHASGDPERALRLYEEALESIRRTRSPDSAERMTLEVQLAMLLRDTGEPRRALSLAEGVLARRLAGHAGDASLVGHARFVVASILARLGRLAEAEEQLVVIARETEDLPEDHVLGLDARIALARIAARRGETAATRPILDHVARGLDRTWRELSLLSPRQVDERLATRERHLSTWLDLAPGAGVDPRRGVALVETARALRSRAPTAAAATDDEVRALRAAVRETRRAVQRAAVDRADGDGLELGDAVGRRDEAERRLRRALADRGLGNEPVDAETIARSLPERACAVGYWRYVGDLGDTPRLLAHVVRPDGRVARVDLGPHDRIERAIVEWRRRLGAPVDEPSARPAAPDVEGRRGVGRVRAAPGPESERAAGEALRRLLLDPVLAETADANALQIAVDDAVHLVPLDALPLGDGRVGDRWRIRIVPSFAPPGANADDRAGDADRLVVFGGIDYGAAPAASGPRSEARAADFRPLLHTRVEAEGVAALFERGRRGVVSLRLGADATKGALDAEAPRAAWLHLATHGTFAGGPLALIEGESDPLAARASFAEVVTGMAPRTLCGLALAGANRGADALGRVEGIVTAEEIAALDLSACRLAVLSACETGLGVRRAGLSVQSMQTALHAAGAAASVTALWGVRDRTTRDLMLEFYRRLWIEAAPLDVALWEAKRSLRDAGRPPFDWAGFVLAGR
ncbi:MAG: CHAT domain-containing protein, partial [Planctomycetota bacterium JB042]